MCNGLIDPSRLYIGVESRVSGCVTGWPVIHQGGVQAVRLHNGQIDPGWLYIEVESRLSGCATGLINSDRLYIRISPVIYRIFALLSACAYIPTGTKFALNSEVRLTARCA